MSCKLDAGPVILSIKLQFTLGNTGKCKHFAKVEKKMSMAKMNEFLVSEFCFASVECFLLNHENSRSILISTVLHL
jgi:hypothetical protein